MCSASSTGLWSFCGESLGGEDRLLGLLGVVGRASWWSSSGLRTGHLGSGWSSQIEELSRGLLASSARCRQDDADLGEQVAELVAAQVGHALALQPERPAVLGARPGSVSRTLPLSVVTGTSPPSSASRERDRQLPLEVRAAAREERHGAGPGRPTRGRRRPAPWPVSLIRVPVVGALGDRHLEALAVDLDAAVSCRGMPPRGSISAIASAPGRPAPASPRRRRSAVPLQAHPAEDVVERSAPPVAGASARRPAGGRRSPAAAAEERPEEVGELAAAAAGRPELVADVAARPASRRRAKPANGLAPALTSGTRACAARRPPSWRPAGRTCLRFSGSDRTALASLTSLNRCSAAASPGLASGWCCAGELAEGLLDLGLGGASRGTPRVS